MCAFSDIDQGVTCSLFGRQCLKEASTRPHAVLPAPDAMRSSAESTRFEAKALSLESQATIPADTRSSVMLPPSRLSDGLLPSFQHHAPSETARVVPNSRSIKQHSHQWADVLGPSNEHYMIKSMSQAYSRMPLPILEIDARRVSKFSEPIMLDFPFQHGHGRNSLGQPLASAGPFATIGAPGLQIGAFTAPAGPVLPPSTPAYPVVFADSERMWGPLSSMGPSANRMDPTLFVRGSIATQSFAGPKTEGKPLKIGKGPNSCFVCGSDAHMWYHCEKKKRGRCAVCGSEAHLTRNCAQRYYAAERFNPPGSNARRESRQDETTGERNTPATNANRIPLPRLAEIAVESEISDQEKEEVIPSSPALCEIAPERDGI